MLSLNEWRLRESGEVVDDELTAEEGAVDEQSQIHLNGAVQKFIGFLTTKLATINQSRNQRAFVAQNIIQALKFRSVGELSRIINEIKSEMQKKKSPMPTPAATTPTAIPASPTTPASTPGMNASRGV